VRLIPDRAEVKSREVYLLLEKEREPIEDKESFVSVIVRKD
jgi:hypothetical protein